MEHQLVTVPDATMLATRLAGFVAERARTSVADHGRFRSSGPGNDHT
jgi:hypothetical protein